jgi:hypothetical protein
MKRRTQITIETERVLIVTNRNRTVDGWCEQCGAVVKLTTPELAATLTGLSRRTVYRLIGIGQVHLRESAEAQSVCLESLTMSKAVNARPDHYQSD